MSVRRTRTSTGALLGLGAAVLAGAALAATTLAAAGCKNEPHRVCPRYVQVRAVTPAVDDPVVAEVNGRPIVASAVRRRAQRKGLTAPEAVSELIDEELLFQEAERRGLHRDRAVVDAGKQAAVYRLLAETFEKDFTPDKVPDADLRQIYDRISARWFKRPELRRYGHAYVTRPWFKRGRHWTIDIEKDRDLRRVMENFQRLAATQRPQTWEAFRALAQGFDQGDQSLAVGTSLSAHRDLRRSFADALFALEGPGALSEVIETRPWYHVAYLREVLPRKNISYAEARAEIRTRHYPKARQRAFQRWVDQLKRMCAIRVKPEHLPVGARTTAPPPAGER